MSTREDKISVVRRVLLDEGGAPDASLHSWRCQYPDRYGHCTCLDEVAAEIVDQLAQLDPAGVTG